MNRLNQIYTILSVLMLAACASSPPAPVEHFYRLKPVAEPVANDFPLPVDLNVSRSTADGLLRERALLYSDDTGHRVLKQHAYHYWADAPAQLLLDYWHLRTKPSGANSVAVNGEISNYDLQIRLRRMERLLNPNGVDVALSLELILLDNRAGDTVLQRRYDVIERASGDRVVDSIEAFETALHEIDHQFVADLTMLSAQTPEE